MVRRLPLHAAARVAGVKPGTIRRWVHDGRLVRHSDGYDLAELLATVDARDHDALLSRAGIKPEDRPGVSLAPQQRRV